MKYQVIGHIEIQDEGRWRRYWFEPKTELTDKQIQEIGTKELEHDLENSGYDKKGFAIIFGTNGVNLTMTAVYNKHLASGEYNPSEIERRKNAKEVKKLIDDFLGA